MPLAHWAAFSFEENSMHTLTDHVDIWNSIKTGAYAGTVAGNSTFGSAVPMAGYDYATILISGSAAAQAGSAAFTAMSATGADNAGSAVISGATLNFVGTAVAANTNQLFAITVKADQLPAASPYLTVRQTIYGDSAVWTGSVHILRYNGRTLPVVNATLLQDVKAVA